MGYDCTLHLIDESAIRTSFVPKLLGRSRKKTDLDRVLKNAKKLWAEVGDALDDEGPETAASMVCQLAVTFAACSLPHQYERGLALSLWDKIEKGGFLADLNGDPEDLFADVVAEYPDLHGHFPTWFTGNYCTGVFLPAARVPAALAWLDDRLAVMTKGRQRDFKGLRGVLRAAVDQKLAYWEATDLAVPMANTFPGDPKLMLAAFLGNEPDAAGKAVEEAPRKGHFRDGNALRFGEWVLSGDFSPLVTTVWDFAAWPPRLAHSLPEFAVSAARARDGRWLLPSETRVTDGPRTFRPRLFADLREKPVGEYPVVLGGEELSIRHAGFVGDRMLAFRQKHHSVKAGDPLPPPVWFDGKKSVPAPGIPARAARKSAIPTLTEIPLAGVVQLGDGGDVVIWDGDGFELRGKTFKLTFPLAAATSHMGDWDSVPAGDDGFFYLSNRRLFEAHRGGKPKRHGPKWSNVMRIGPGPAGSLVLHEGENDDGDVAKLYFPADKTFAHIGPELFDDHDHSFIHWSEPAGRFVVAGKGWLAVKQDVVLALPRFRATTGEPAALR